MKRVSTGARVTLVLEIDLQDSWGDDCKLDQVFKQAGDGARNAVRKLCDESRGAIRLVNILEVSAVTRQRDE